MTPKVTVTFVVGLTQFMTPRFHGVNLTYLMTPKVNMTFDLDLDLKVKHLSWQVTTHVKLAI